MARTTGLARVRANGTGVAVEVSGPEIDDLAIPTAGQKRALHQRAESGFASIHERPNERVSGDFETVERLPTAAFVIRDVVIETAVDGVGSSLAFGIERGEPTPRLRFAPGRSRGCARHQRRAHRPRGRRSFHGGARCRSASPTRRFPWAPERKAPSDRHPVPGFLRRNSGSGRTGVELGVPNGASHREIRFPKNMQGDKGGHARTKNV